MASLPVTKKSNQQNPIPAVLLLPNHITTLEIFSKLPITSLIQCRCVCRSWRRSLSDPDFAKHLLSLTPPSLLLKHRRAFYLLEPSLRNGAVIKLAENDPSFLAPHIEPVGSANGVLAVRYNVDHFYLSNPILGEALPLPRPTVRINCKFVCGFGTSAVSNVYKLVMVSIPEKKPTEEDAVEEVQLKPTEEDDAVEVMVLTVGTGKWRNIGSSVYTSWIDPSGVYLDGVIHWIVTTGQVRDLLDDYYMICAFDVETESFREFPLPPGSFPAGGVVKLELGVLGGCLTVNTCYKNKLSVWVMKEYGVHESWRNQYDILDIVKGTFSSYPNAPRVLRVTEEPWKPWQVLLYFKHGLHIHNFGSRGVFQQLAIDRMPLVVHGACHHVPSFVSLKYAIGRVQR